MQSQVPKGPCRICQDSSIENFVSRCRDFGWGYKRVYRELKKAGFELGRAEVQNHCSHAVRNVMSSIDDAEANAEAVVTLDYFAARGIELPPEGWKIVAGTISEKGADGETHWIRVKPESEDDDERVEIRQAEPIVISDVRPSFTVFVPGDWQTWLITPDAQFGYWRAFDDSFHSIHDERCFDLAHQIAWIVAEDEGLFGWLDVGDFVDNAAPSRHNPTTIDLSVKCINKGLNRASAELAKRRFVVGPEGKVVVLGGNHDIRFRTKANQEQPYLVGLKRAGDPEEEHPVMSVPYLVRARDYDVEWIPSWPQVYRKLNSNLVAFHAPAYGSKALDTSRKIAAKVHSSVVFGHTHRREALAENIETSKGNRTLEIWSDGTFARTDGSTPSQNNSFDDYGDRQLVGSMPEELGMLSEAWHQGLSVVHVERSGRERFSVERVAIWDGWCSFRGRQLQSSVDEEGIPVTNEVLAAA